MTIDIIRRFAVLAVVLVSAWHVTGGVYKFFQSPPSVSANPASDLRSISYLNDYWFNYDGSGSYGSSSVDWPLRFVLYGNAEVD